jgi:hypothetical protein
MSKNYKHWNNLKSIEKKRQPKWIIVSIELKHFHDYHTTSYVLDETTLQWPSLGCHIVLLFKDVHVWVYFISNFWKIFTIFLHI